MSCVLRASGANFDVDSFLNDSSLDALTYFIAGAPLPGDRRRSADIPE